MMAQRQRFDRWIHVWAAIYNAIMAVLVGWICVTGVQTLHVAVEVNQQGSLTLALYHIHNPHLVKGTWVGIINSRLPTT